MFLLTKYFTFEASHQLPNHDGACRNLHGHSWRGALVVRGDALHMAGAKHGMLIDYHDMSKVIDPVVEQLDHHHLNEVVAYPTSEMIAEWIFDRCALPLQEMGYRLHSVIIEETCTSKCEYIWDAAP